MSLTLFRIAVRNEPGALARVTRYLANWHVDLKGFVVDPAGMQLLTEDADAARRAFDEAGIVTMMSPVLEFSLTDRPGALAQVCQRLADANIDIVSAFGVAVGSTNRICILANDMARAAPIIEAFNRGAPVAASRPPWARA